MKITVRILACLLSVLLLVSVFGCAKPETPANDTTAGAQTAGDTVPETDEKDLIDPKLPALNWGGEEFHIMYNGNDLEPNLDFVAEEINGALLNDAVYNRNRAIENKHNLKITYQFDSDSNIVSAIERAFAGGEDIVQLAEVNQNYSMTMAIKGNLIEYGELKNVNLEKPYWYSGLLSGSSLKHKNYFAYSDANVHAFGATPVTIFNKTVHADHKFDDLYKIVTDGGWTHEVMSGMVKEVTADKDGDGKITKDDYLGMIANTFCIDCFISGSGYQMITKDDDDLPVLNITDEKFANIIQSIVDLCSVENGMFLVDRTSTATEAREYWTEHAITEDRALFWIGNFKCVERLRVSDTDFGVVPIPKVNAEQQEYKVHMQANIGAAMSVPKSAEARTEDISTILEDIAFMSNQSVMPEYMEVLIQGQSIRDSDSLVCINIIRNAYYCDMGFMLGNYGVAILTAMRNVVKDNTSISTAVKSQEKSFTGNYKKIIDDIKD